MTSPLVRNLFRFIHLSQIIPIAFQCFLLIGISALSWNFQSFELAVLGYALIVVVSALWYFRRQVYHTEMFKSVLESAPLTVFVWDSLLKKMIFVNSKAQAQLGLEINTQDSIRQYLKKFLPNKDSINVIKLLRKCTEIGLQTDETSDNNDYSDSIVVDLKNQKKINLRFFPVKISQSLNRVLVVGFIEDETVKIKLQNALEYEKAKSAHLDRLNALSEMAGGIAHEINNPLAIISGRAQSLRIKAQQGRLESLFLLDSLKKIEDTSLRISKIITGLRTIARDGSKDEFCNVSIDVIIDDALTFWGQRLKNHNIEIGLDIKEPSLMIHCRPVQITQVILNLIGNSFSAIKDSADSKWIRIDVCSNKNSMVEIKILDSGSGIPNEIKSKIFDPFFTTKPIGEGTGLGLTLAMGVLKDHHGKIYLDESSSNTCFVLTIPRSVFHSRLAA